MGKAITGLKLFQWGQEADATPGTAVAATSKIGLLDLEFEDDDEVDRPQLAKGLVTSNPGSELVVSRGMHFTIPDSPVVFDQIHNMLGMAIIETPAATGADPYTWIHTRNIAADTDPNTRTLERRVTDGTNSVDHEWAYCLLTEIGFKFKAGEALKFHAKGFGRRRQASVLTPALAFPTIEHPAAALGQVWIDAAWANLGTTLIAAQVLEGSCTFKTGFGPKLAIDGRSDLDMSTHLLNAKDVGMELTMKLLIEANAGQYATELTAAEALTLRAIRAKFTGTQTRSLQLDGLYKHKKGSLQKIGEEDGADIVEMSLVNATDGTNLFSTTTVNKINTTN